MRRSSASTSAAGAAGALRAPRTKGTERMGFLAFGGLVVTDELLDAVADRVVLRLGAKHQQQQEQQWMNADEAAAHLRCNRQRLYNLVADRRIPHEHEGKRLLFDRAALDEWVRNGGGR